jgi:hypothetical protein
MSGESTRSTSNPDETGAGEITDSASSEYASTDESRDEASDAPGSGSETQADAAGSGDARTGSGEPLAGASGDDLDGR